MEHLEQLAITGRKILSQSEVFCLAINTYQYQLFKVSPALYM